MTHECIDKVGLQYPVSTMDHHCTPKLFKETFPSGRGKFHPLDYVPVKEMPDDILTTGRLLEH